MMLFTGLLTSLNKAVELALSGSTVSVSNEKREEYEQDNFLDEKKSLYISKPHDIGIFGKLKRSTSNRSILKFQLKKTWNLSNPSINSTTTLVSPPSPTPLWKEQVDSYIKNTLSSSEIHRQEVMFEIIRTEKDFVEDIQFFNNHYVTSFENSGIRLPPSLGETCKIMSDLLLLHNKASIQLRCIQATMHPIIPSIAHVLKELAVHFYLYEAYLIHHKMAISEIANARKKNNKLGQTIKDLESDLPQGRILTLESLITKPFQRLCKYPLLVMTLLRATSADHKDRAHLINLYSQIDGALRELQERKSDYELSLENDFPRKFGSMSIGRFNKFTAHHRSHTH